MYMLAARIRTVAPRKLTAYARSEAGHTILWMLAHTVLAATRPA